MRGPQRYVSLRISRMLTSPLHKKKRVFSSRPMQLEPGPHHFKWHSIGGYPIRPSWCERFSLVMGGIPSCEFPLHDAATRDLGIVTASDLVPDSLAARVLPPLPPCRPQPARLKLLPCPNPRVSVLFFPVSAPNAWRIRRCRQQHWKRFQPAKLEPPTDRRMSRKP
jgi:hypothetical protein